MVAFVIQYLGGEVRQIGSRRPSLAAWLKKNKKIKRTDTQRKKKGKKSKYIVHVIQCCLWSQLSTGALEHLLQRSEDNCNQVPVFIYSQMSKVFQRWKGACHHWSTPTNTVLSCVSKDECLWCFFNKNKIIQGLWMYSMVGCLPSMARP